MKKPVLSALVGLCLLGAPAVVFAQHGHGAHPAPAAAPAATPAPKTEHAGHAMEHGQKLEHAAAPKAEAPAKKAAPVQAVVKNGVQTLAVEVTDAGFVPADVQVKAGQPVRLVVTRKTPKGCANELVLEDLGIHQALPLDTPVTVEFTPTETGTLKYACAMGHMGGRIIVAARK